MTLNDFDERYIKILMSWFDCKNTLLSWSGPNFRFPFTRETFERDLLTDKMASYVLCNENAEVIGFGQYYNRLSRCHLSRLVISPKHRGLGLAKTLIELLCLEGTKQLNSTGYSLFVLANNKSAIKAYTKLGFKLTDYPGEIDISDCLYMTKD